MISLHTPVCAAKIEARLAVIRQKQIIAAPTTESSSVAQTDQTSEIAVEVGGVRFGGFSFDNDVEHLFAAFAQFGINFREFPTVAGTEEGELQLKSARVHFAGIGSSNLMHILSEAGEGLKNISQKMKNVLAGFHKIPGAAKNKTALQAVEIELWNTFRLFVAFAINPTSKTTETSFRGEAQAIVTNIEGLLGKSNTGILGKWQDALQLLVTYLRIGRDDKTGLAAGLKRLKIAARSAGRVIDDEVKSAIALKKVK